MIRNKMGQEPPEAGIQTTQGSGNAPSLCEGSLLEGADSRGSEIVRGFGSMSDELRNDAPEPCLGFFGRSSGDTQIVAYGLPGAGVDRFCNKHLL